MLLELEAGVPVEDAARVFSQADKDGSGLIDYRELISVLSVFLQGSESEKLNLLFGAFDGGSG